LEKYSKLTKAVLISDQTAHFPLWFKAIFGVLFIAFGLTAMLPAPLAILRFRSGKLVIPTKGGQQSVNRKSNPASYWIFLTVCTLVLVPIGIKMLMIGINIFSN
jgi:hypothetical protein